MEDRIGGNLALGQKKTGAVMEAKEAPQKNQQTMGSSKKKTTKSRQPNKRQRESGKGKQRNPKKTRTKEAEAKEAAEVSEGPEELGSPPVLGADDKDNNGDDEDSSPVSEAKKTGTKEAEAKEAEETRNVPRDPDEDEDDEDRDDEDSSPASSMRDANEEQEEDDHDDEQEQEEDDHDDGEKAKDAGDLEPEIARGGGSGESASSSSSATAAGREEKKNFTTWSGIDLTEAGIVGNAKIYISKNVSQCVKFVENYHLSSDSPLLEGIARNFGHDKESKLWPIFQKLWDKSLKKVLRQTLQTRRSTITMALKNRFKGESENDCACFVVVSETKLTIQFLFHE